MDIVGNIGTNSTFHFTSNPTLVGGVYFNGAGAGWNSCSPTGYTVSTSSTALEWKTVDEIAREFYPSGTYSPNGLDYIATNNNNANAVPAITSNSITDNVTLKAGHYYITNLNLTGSRKITFDNAAGPIYLWIGPRAGSAVAHFRGGSAAVTTTSANSCYIFCATQGGVDLAGNETLDAVVYSYNTEGSTSPYGYIENSGHPTINGAIITGSSGINGNVGLNYRAYDRTFLKNLTYEFNKSWEDLTPGY